MFTEADVAELKVMVKEMIDAEAAPGQKVGKAPDICINSFISSLLDEPAFPQKSLLSKISALPGPRSKKQPMMGQDREEICFVTRSAWSLYPDYQGANGRKLLDEAIIEVIRVKLNVCVIRKC